MSHIRDYNRFMETNGVSLNDRVGIFEADFDPSISGQAGPVGSLLLRHDIPSLWQKNNIGDLNWIQIPISDFAGDIAFLSGEIDANNSDINNLSGAIDNTSGDVIIISGTVDNLEINDLTDVDTAIATPVTGDFLRWDGANWIPASSPTLSAQPVSNNIVYGIDNTTQVLVATNVFQIVTFNNILEIEGWTYSAGNFTSLSGGNFMITYDVNVEKAGGGNVQMASKVNKNGTEITGSHNGMDITSNNTAFSISRTFVFSTDPGDIINLLYAGNSITAGIIPPPTPGGVNTPVGVSMLIRRII